jgi:EAL domain-containing protein (putative c-di-GMP-specific phosphodiesterase class I)
MARNNDLAHNSQLTREITDWQEIGENVGVGGDERSVADAFMGSPDHRDNILNPRYSEIGIATATGSDGRLWVTEDFERPFGATAVAKPHRSTSHRSVATPVVHRQPTARHSPAKAPRKANRPAAVTPAQEAVRRATAVMNLPANRPSLVAASGAEPKPAGGVSAGWWSAAVLAFAPFWLSGRSRRLANQTITPRQGGGAPPVLAALALGPVAVIVGVLGWWAGLPIWQVALAALLVPNAAFVGLAVMGAVVASRRHRVERAAPVASPAGSRLRRNVRALPAAGGPPWWPAHEASSYSDLLGASVPARMRNVFASGQLEIALQPIIDLITGSLVSAEALARFPDTRPPNEWFAEAYAFGLGSELELQAVEGAVAAADRLPSDVRLSVNISPQLALERIILEITEHTAVHNYPSIRDALLPLRGNGVKLAVDDAGAGYASFAHVLQLRPEIIKLDRSLIAGIDRDPAARAFVTGVVLLALELGAVVVAEGVETADQLAQLQALGIDAVQGYLLASPTTDTGEWQTWNQKTWNLDSLTHPAPAQAEPITLPRTIHV